MAGLYGSLSSREDFFSMLGEARCLMAEFLRNGAQHPVFRSIQMQLDAIADWTRDGRQPTQEERRSIDMGLRVVRELSDTDDPAIDAFNDKIHCLSGYFQDWPTDEEAANSQDGDPVYLRRDF